MLVLGGAKESLDARPSSEYILTLKNRKGFVKIGLVNGASLVPVFSFGENDLYEQVANPRGSRIRQIQMIQKRLGYATPFFKGRGIFQYAVGFIPNRHAIDTYVGEPIELPKLERDQITPDIVDKYHTEYMEALKRLFDTHKAKHGNADATIKYVSDDE
jgi:2-acylglycerol O-acyltransferase 2